MIPVELRELVIKNTEAWESKRKEIIRLRAQYNLNAEQVQELRDLADKIYLENSAELVARGWRVD